MWFSFITSCFTHLTYKEVLFVWSYEFDERFQRQMTLLTTAPTVALQWRVRILLYILMPKVLVLGVFLMQEIGRAHV